MSDAYLFGAAGDGTTDDTAAIEHALKDGDGTLYLSRGDYRITRTIELLLGKTGRLGIAGDGTARVLMDGAGPAFRFVGTHEGSAGPSSFKPEVWTHQRMPQLRGIEIVGLHNEAIGVQFEGVMQPTLIGVLIRQCRIGVHLVKRNRNVLIADSHIYHGRGPAIGVYFDGVNLHQANIVGCHISYHGHAGIKVARSEIRNFQITGCDIEYNYVDGAPDCADVWIDSREGTVREGTIASCTIQAKLSPGGCNVRIEGAPNAESSSAGLWTIAGNIIQSQHTNLLLRSVRGIAVTGNSFCSGYDRNIVLDRCRNIAVGTNTFDFNPDYKGPRVDGITVRGCSGINLHGLVVESARSGSRESGGALEVFDSEAVTVSGCQFFDPEHRAIYLEKVRTSSIRGCTVLARKPNPTMHEAITRKDCGADVIVEDNSI
jgi:hypothetical protein